MSCMTRISMTGTNTLPPWPTEKRKKEKDSFYRDSIISIRVVCENLFCPHFSLCFWCITLYYTLAIALCFVGFCK